MDFVVLSEEDDFIKFLIELIAGDIFDDCWEALVLGQHLEVNGIIGREIFVFWFYACERKEDETGILINPNSFRARRFHSP